MVPENGSIMRFANRFYLALFAGGVQLSIIMSGTVEATLRQVIRQSYRAVTVAK
jgi:hypothetical protein